MAEHILTNSRIILNQELMTRMIDYKQSALIKLCLKYKAEYDEKIKKCRITLSGHFMEEVLSNKILLSDFVHLMLDKMNFEKLKEYLIYLKDFINF